MEPIDALRFTTKLTKHVDSSSAHIKAKRERMHFTHHESRLGEKFGHRDKFI